MKSGTDVAQEASDVILLDDNFNSCVQLVMWGRCVYDNIRKFVQFQLTVNVVALCMAFIGAISYGASPLTAVQLLWVNLIMDSLGALALGTELPTQSLLLRKPYGRVTPLISKEMVRHIAGGSVYQLVVLLVFLYKGCDLWGIPAAECGVEMGTHYSMFFNIFVFMQLFNQINSRKVNAGEMNIFQNMFYPTVNWYIIVIFFFSAGTQILLVELGGHALKTKGLNAPQWISSILLGAAVLPWGYVVRLLPVPTFMDKYLYRFTPAYKSEQQAAQELKDATKKGASGTV